MSIQGHVTKGVRLKQSPSKLATSWLPGAWHGVSKSQGPDPGAEGPGAGRMAEAARTHGGDEPVQAGTPLAGVSPLSPERQHRADDQWSWKSPSSADEQASHRWRCSCCGEAPESWQGWLSLSRLLKEESEAEGGALAQVTEPHTVTPGLAPHARGFCLRGGKDGGTNRQGHFRASWLIFWRRTHCALLLIVTLYQRCARGLHTLSHKKAALISPIIQTRKPRPIAVEVSTPRR